MTRPIDRRHFLRLSGFAAPALAPALLRRETQRGADKSGDAVAGVGAGLAGLRAASLLRLAGRQVIVLEARPAAGGRVRTIRSPFDEGLYGEAGPIRITGAHRAVIKAVRAF